MHVDSMADSQVSTLPLEIDSLVKRFGQVTAMDGVSLELKQGNAWGCWGRTGQVRAR